MSTTALLLHVLVAVSWLFSAVRQHSAARYQSTRMYAGVFRGTGLLWHSLAIHHLWHWMAYNVLMCR